MPTADAVAIGSVDDANGI